MTRSKKIVAKLSRKLKKLESTQDDFTEEDFVEILDLTMQKQALEYPALKDIYKKLTPEFEARVRKVQEMFETPDERDEMTLFQELLREGPDVILPILEFLLHLKHLKRDQTFS